MREFAASVSRMPAFGASSSYWARPVAASTRMDPGSELVPPFLHCEMQPDTCEGSPE
jgi:hypothetical protein